MRSRSDSFRAGAEGASWTNVAIDRLYGAEDGEDFRGDLLAEEGVVEGGEIDEGGVGGDLITRHAFPCKQWASGVHPERLTLVE